MARSCCRLGTWTTTELGWRREWDSSAFAASPLRRDLIVSESHPPESRARSDASGGGWPAGRSSRVCVWRQMVRLRPAGYGETASHWIVSEGWRREWDSNPR